MITIKYLGWYLAGFILVPILCLLTPAGSREWKYLDRIYGNPIDGIGGDIAYKAKVTRFRRFRWSQLRNPLNNYLRSLGPSGTVESIRREGDTVYATIAGKEWYFRQREVIAGRLYLWTGTKLIDDNRIDSKLEVGHYFHNMLCPPLWPFKANRIEHG